MCSGAGDAGVSVWAESSSHEAGRGERGRGRRQNVEQMVDDHLLLVLLGLSVLANAVGAILLTLRLLPGLDVLVVHVHSFVDLVAQSVVISRTRCC